MKSCLVAPDVSVYLMMFVISVLCVWIEGVHSSFMLNEGSFFGKHLWCCFMVLDLYPFRTLLLACIVLQMPCGSYSETTHGLLFLESRGLSGKVSDVINSYKSLKSHVIIIWESYLSWKGMWCFGNADGWRFIPLSSETNVSFHHGLHNQLHQLQCLQKSFWVCWDENGQSGDTSL